MRITFDRDGYPTDESLADIAGATYADAWDVLDAVAAAWHYPHGVRRELDAAEDALVRRAADERFLRLATGGWSGNESLVSALWKSEVGKLTWVLRARGGLWIFRYPRTA